MQKVLWLYTFYRKVSFYKYFRLVWSQLGDYPDSVYLHNALMVLLERKATAIFQQRCYSVEWVSTTPVFLKQFVKPQLTVLFGKLQQCCYVWRALLHLENFILLPSKLEMQTMDLVLFTFYFDLFFNFSGLGRPFWGLLTAFLTFCWFGLWTSKLEWACLFISGEVLYAAPTNLLIVSIVANPLLLWGYRVISSRAWTVTVGDLLQ